MAEYRERPYAQFNFQVDIEGLPGPGDAKAGFQEVSGIGMEVTASDYRPGNYKENSPMKITTIHKVPDITLKRGVMGALELWNWLKDVRDGKQDQLKKVTISLWDEARTKAVQKWVLTNARPIKYTGPSLSGKGGEVAIEELVLACEKLDQE
jgi:phage tail-like protein